MATAPQPADWSTGQFVSNDENPSAVPHESLSTALADMVARVKGTDPTENGFRLYEFIDPESLDTLYEHSKRWEASDWRLEFSTGEERVVVRSDGFIRVRRST